MNSFASAMSPILMLLRDIDSDPVSRAAYNAPSADELTKLSASQVETITGAPILKPTEWSAH